MDQLSQSREDSQREVRAQASQVTFWTENVKSGQVMRPDLHILNRSLDPVTNADFAVADRYHQPYVSSRVELPPCTETVYEGWDLSLFHYGSQISTPMQALPGGPYVYLAFTDSHGMSWTRSKTDLVEGRKAVMDADGVGHVRVNKGHVKEADACGDDHG
ncbi:hypothetical protein ACFRIC_16890 [Streptomyces sp. NPDC056738]|uniref:hypothetical protein n=1 Tax=Streptomyces sp. NPDC056738 TaxID=3345933 RepID=UPI0036B978F1